MWFSEKLKVSRNFLESSFPAIPNVIPQHQLFRVWVQIHLLVHPVWHWVPV